MGFAQTGATGRTRDAKTKRLTTPELDPAGCDNSYSYWPTWNANGTIAKVLGWSRGAILLPGNTLAIPGNRTPSGATASLEDLIWSSHPHRLFVHSIGAELWQRDVVRAEWDSIHDFTGELRGKRLFQMSVSDDDQTFAFSDVDEQNKVLGFLVWSRKGGIVWSEKVNGQEVCDEVQIDKTGRYLCVCYANPAGRFDVIDLLDHKRTKMSTGAPHWTPSHWDLGAGVLVGCDLRDNLHTIAWRSLATPKVSKVLHQMPRQTITHISMRGKGDDWAIVSTYGIGIVSEVLRVATDGSGRYRRLAYSGSAYEGGYRDTPRANVSRDGRRVAWTSNMGTAGGRTDVFGIEL